MFHRHLSKGTYLFGLTRKGAWVDLTRYSREGGCGPLEGGWVWTSKGRVGVDLSREGGCEPLIGEWMWISQGRVGVNLS